jgi:hypothetical protein
MQHTTHLITIKMLKQNQKVARVCMCHCSCLTERQAHVPPTDNVSSTMLPKSELSHARQRSPQAQLHTNHIYHSYLTALSGMHSADLPNASTACPAAHTMLQQRNRCTNGITPAHPHNLRQTERVQPHNVLYAQTRASVTSCSSLWVHEKKDSRRIMQSATLHTKSCAQQKCVISMMTQNCHGSKLETCKPCTWRAASWNTTSTGKSAVCCSVASRACCNHLFDAKTRLPTQMPHSNQLLRVN